MSPQLPTAFDNRDTLKPTGNYCISGAGLNKISVMLAILSHFFVSCFLAATPFQEGIKLHQEGRYIEALEKFQLADSQAPGQPNILLNWGISAFEAQKRGLALGLWRKALSIDPHFIPAAKALDYARSQLPEQVFSSHKSLLETLKSDTLRYVSIENLFFLNWLLLAFGGVLLVRYFSRRKQALEDDLPLPPTPSIAILFVVLFILSIGLGALKWLTHQEPRATVISDSVDLRTSPNETSNTVYNLIEGMEVIIEHRQDDWTLVSHHEGLTGWVPSSTILQNSGPSL